MARVAISGRIDAPAERVWAVARDFANLEWVPDKSYLRVDGRGPGMVRTVAMGPGPRARERLDSVDDAGRCLEYSVLAPERASPTPPGAAGAPGAGGPPPFPVRDYHGRMQVRARDAHSCELDWSFRFEPAGVSEQEAIAAIAHVAGLLFGWFKPYVER
jgi:hypothetical protein